MYSAAFGDTLDSTITHKMMHYQPVVSSYHTTSIVKELNKKATEKKPIEMILSQNAFIPSVYQKD